jgi:hypothetical protein
VTVTIGQSSLAANVATEASIPHPSPFWRLLRN